MRIRTIAGTLIALAVAGGIVYVAGATYFRTSEVVQVRESAAASPGYPDGDFEKLLEASAKITIGADSKAVTSYLDLDCSGNICSSTRTQFNWVGYVVEIGIMPKDGKVSALYVCYGAGDVDALRHLMTEMFGEPTVTVQEIQAMTSKSFEWRHDGYTYTLSRYSGTTINGDELRKKFTLVVSSASSQP